MKDFWLSCGHHLLDRDQGGWLVVTDEFLKAYMARPELSLPSDACPVERMLHAALPADPRRPVAAAELATIVDVDARENWTLMTAWHDLLVARRTIEAAYLHLVRQGSANTPSLFLNQLVHVILRNVLDGCEDVFMLRAAELFFRPQRLTTLDGLLIAADDETVAGTNAQSASPLVAMLGLSAGAAIEVPNDDNAATYWQRSNLFDMAIDITAGRRGLAALGAVIARWVEHLQSVKVGIEPLIHANNVELSWYVGIDGQATKIGDALWNGEDVDEATRARIVGLYGLTIAEADTVLEQARGAPIYLLMAMTPDSLLRMKSQNLVIGLPVRQREAVS